MGDSVRIDDVAWQDHASWWHAEATQARQRLAVDDATLERARTAFGKIGSSSVGAALADTLRERHAAGQRLGDYAQGVANHIRRNLGTYSDGEKLNAQRLGADYHGRGGVQMVDNRTPLPQEPSPPLPEPPPYLPPAPGAQPQIGPFPVPAPVAQATPSLIGPTDPTGGLLTPPPVSTAPQGPPEILPGKPIPGIQAAGPAAPAPAPAPSPWSHPGCTEQQWRDAWLLYAGTGAGMGASLAFGPEAAIPAWVAGIPIEIAQGDQIIACTEPPPAHKLSGTG